MDLCEGPAGGGHVPDRVLSGRDSLYFEHVGLFGGRVVPVKLPERALGGTYAGRYDPFEHDLGPGRDREVGKVRLDDLDSPAFEHAGDHELVHWIV